MGCRRRQHRADSKVVGRLDQRRCSRLVSLMRNRRRKCQAVIVVDASEADLSEAEHKALSGSDDRLGCLIYLVARCL